MWRVGIAAERVVYTYLSMVSRKYQVIREVENSRLGLLKNYLLKCSIDSRLTNKEFRQFNDILQFCFVCRRGDLLEALFIVLLTKYAVYDKLLSFD